MNHFTATQGHIHSNNQKEIGEDIGNSSLQDINKNTPRDSSPNINNNICILHDTFLYRGGAERLILMMGKALNADIASGFFDPESFDLKKEGFTGKIIAVSTPWLKKQLRQLKLRFVFLFKTGFLKEYETVIFSGDCIGAVRNVRKGAKKIYYCHTPPRYIFDRKDDYLKKVSWFMKPVFLIALSLFRAMYLRDLSKMDIIVTNSENTRKRLKTYTGYDSIIIHPPVDTSHFVSDPEANKKHYLSFSRLANIKRVDRIVEAFQGLPDKKLVFTYGKNDPDAEKVLSLCDGYSNIIPIQSPSESELKKLVQEAIATIYIPIDEDFGMISVESQSAGVPIIGVRDGGILETVIDGETGILIDPSAPINEIRDAVNSLTPIVAENMKESCRKQSMKFSYETFSQKLRNLL